MVSSDNEGSVKIWNINCLSVLSKIGRHKMCAWSVDCCAVNQSLFASGSGDGTMTLLPADRRNSCLTIGNKPAHLYTKKLHLTSAEARSVCSVDYHEQYFDLRNTKKPLRVFHGHRSEKLLSLAENSMINNLWRTSISTVLSKRAFDSTDVIMGTSM